MSAVDGSCRISASPRSLGVPHSSARRPWLSSGPPVRLRQAGIFGRYSQTTRRESRTVVLVRSRLASG